MSTAHSDRDERDPDRRLRTLRAAVGRARLSIAVERLWPRLVPLLSLGGLFVALSWFGYWRMVPETARLATLGLFAVAATALTFRLVFVRMPDETAGMDRVETASGLPHRPAHGLRDHISPVANDAVAAALWAAERQRLLQSLRGLRAGAPAPEMARRDPNALRFAVPVLLVVAFAMAWGEWLPRLGEAFAEAGMPAAAAEARIDAWVDPPAYTRQPPVYLSRRDPALRGEPVRVPEGSKLSVRIVSEEAASVTFSASGEERILAAQGGSGAAPADSEAIRSYAAILDRDGTLAVAHANGTVSYPIVVIDDAPPTIARGPMTVNRSGSFSLDFTVGDDYGVTDGSVTFRPAAPASEEARPLVEPPTVPLRTGRNRQDDGAARADGRLEAHPYAGLQVLADAVVRDAAGQEARPADAGDMTLPSRRFINPLARALVEQRQILALDADAKPKVLTALDALALAPERFVKDLGVYLGLRVGYFRLVEARSDDDLRNMLDYLWGMARIIEDGDMSEAQQRLNQAREALQDALENGAGDEEIARLTQELRQALQDFMQSMMAEMAQRGADQLPTMPDSQMQMLSQQDLNRMLDRIEDLARLGDREAAQQLLSQLQQMLDNLQMAQPGQMSPGSQEAMRQMEELGRIMREQQRLMDDTFQLDQGRRPGDRGQNGESRPLTPSELAELMQQLREGQAALEQSLQELMQQGQGQGQQGEQGGEGQQGQGQLGQGQGLGQGEGQRALGRAGRAMGDATGSLGRGQSGEAYGFQGEALEALRDGLQGMMEQMFANQGQGQQPGGRGLRMGRTDPLGRPQRAEGPDLGQNVEIPDEIDVERARRILNAIRERLGERFRPRFELDYLERLLNSE